MGGNAFKNISTVRLTGTAYRAYANLVMERLRLLDEVEAVVIPSYRNKLDHGDLDILWFAPPGVKPQMLTDLLGATDDRVIRNGPVTSCVPSKADFGVDFQVDLIRVLPSEFDFALGYFSYNDLGNLMGRVAHYMGFKFGHRGLLYVYRDPDNDSNVVDELVVTRDWDAALQFLGYFSSHWHKGFDTLEQVFEYAVSSPYACQKLFNLFEVNHQARIRDRKRKTYSTFVNWCENPENGVPVSIPDDKEHLRYQMFNQARVQFIGFGKACAEAKQKLYRQKVVKTRFNGKLVQELTGLEGKELGMFMRSFRETYPDEWVFTHAPDEVKEKILNFYGD